MKKLVIPALALAVCLLSAGVFQFAIATANTNQMWRPLSEIIAPEKLAEIVAESTAPSADRNAIAQSALGYEQNDLLLVDFNTPTLCGIGGCALAGYQTSTGERVLAVYVERTSADEPLVEVIEQPGECPEFCVSGLKSYQFRRSPHGSQEKRTESRR
ncbi:MAG: hypothetical protein AAFZ17_19730 [Cyanobacteria bacterium J06650_10]